MDSYGNQICLQMWKSHASSILSFFHNTGHTLHSILKILILHLEKENDFFVNQKVVVSTAAADNLTENCFVKGALPVKIHHFASSLGISKSTFGLYKATTNFLKIQTQFWSLPIMRTEKCFLSPLECHVKWRMLSIPQIITVTLPQSTNTVSRSKLFIKSIWVLGNVSNCV